MGHERTVKQVDDELDETCVQMVQLMDDYLVCIGRIDKCLRDGCVHLAKSRYLMGNRSVSDLQLPTVGPYTARSLVECDNENDNICLVTNEDGDDPIKRFGVLVPGSLRIAQEGFCKCLESAVEAANVQREMEKLQKCVLNLKSVRNQMIKTSIL